MDKDHILNIKNKYLANSKKYYIPETSISIPKEYISKLKNLASRIKENIDNLNKIKLQTFNIENIGEFYNDFETIFNETKTNYTEDISKLLEQKNTKQQKAGGIGGHAGAIGIFDFITTNSKNGSNKSNNIKWLGKKFTQKKINIHEQIYVYKVNKEDQLAQNNELSIDIELFIYFFFLTLNNNNNNNKKHNTTQTIINTSANSDIFNILNNLLPVLTIDLLPTNNNKPCIYVNKNSNDELYYTLGNLKPNHSSENPQNILDYKLGCYTVNPSEKNINTLISCKDFTCKGNSSLDKLKVLNNELKEFMKQIMDTKKNIPLQTGGGVSVNIDLLSYLAKYFTDFTSTSSHYGFRCEGVDDLFNNIYDEYLFLLIGKDYSFKLNTWNKVLVSGTNINVPNKNIITNDISVNKIETLTKKQTNKTNTKANKTNTKTNKTPKQYDITNYDLIKKITTESSTTSGDDTNKIILFNPDVGLINKDVNGNYNKLDEETKKFKKSSYILLNKNKVFNDMNTIFTNFYNTFEKIKSKLYNNQNVNGNQNDNLDLLQYICVMNHFTFINYFDHDNSVLRKIVMGKSSLFNKAPNYFLPPLIQYKLFYGNYNDDEKKKLQKNLDNFITLICLNQFDAILKGDTVIICSFVGSSVVTNVETQEVRLIDFGHPIFFNAANLQYLVVSNVSNNNTRYPKTKEEDEKYRQLFSIFMNFAYGALSYYFMLTIYLESITNPNINNKVETANSNIDNNILKKVIKLLYFALYYTQSLSYGFPLINKENVSTNIDLIIKTFMTNEELISNVSKINEITNAFILSNTYNAEDNSDNSEKYNNFMPILPSQLEEELLLLETSFEEQSKLSRSKTDMSKSRCDIVKYMYILRLLSLIKSNNLNPNINIDINKYDSKKNKKLQ